jgi:hypothetical protein
MDWTTEVTVEFTPLPKEKEEAYWSAIRYFAEIIFADLEENVDESLINNLTKREQDLVEIEM